MKKYILNGAPPSNVGRLRLTRLHRSVLLLFMMLCLTPDLQAGNPVHGKTVDNKNPATNTDASSSAGYMLAPPCSPFATITPLGPLTFCSSTPLQLEACNQYTFTHTLEGLQEVPPVITAATGTISGVFNAFTNELTIDVSYQGFLSATTAAHLHVGSAGNTGLIIEDLAPQFVAGTTSGQFNKIVTLSSSEATALLNGGIYINIHTQNFPAGEIRAQLSPVLDCQNFIFSWSTGENTSSIFVNASGTYEVIVINDIGCQDSTEVTVTVNEASIVNAGPDQNICASDTIHLNATLSGQGTALVWQLNSAFGTFIDPDTSPSTRFVLNANGRAQSSISFGVMSNDPPGVCQGGMDTVVIFIAPAAEVSAGTNKRICQTDTNPVTLDGSIGGLATMATWSGGSGTFLPDANTLNAVYVPSAAEIASADDIILTLTTDDPAGLCPAAFDEMLFQIDSAALVDAGPDQSICVGDTIYLNATLSGVATALVWQLNSAYGNFIDPDTWASTRFVLNATGQSLSSISFGVMTNDPGSNVCQGGKDTVVIQINPGSMDVSISPNDPVNICENDSVQLSTVCNLYAFAGQLSGVEQVPPNNTPAIGSYTGTFNSSSRVLTLNLNFTGLLGVSTGLRLHQAPFGLTGPDIVDLTGSLPLFVNSGSMQTSAVLTPAQTGALLTGQVYINLYSSFFASGELRGQIFPALNCQVSSYQWSTGATTPDIWVSSAGTYTVTVTSTGGCADEESVVVNVNPAALVDAGPDQNICASDTIYLNATLSGAATQLVWEKNVAFGDFIDPDTWPSTRFVLNANGRAQSSISFGVMTNDPSGVCESALDTVVINIAPAAEVNAGTDTRLCQTSDVFITLDGSIGGVATTATWSGGSGNFLPNANTLNAVYVPSAAEIAAADDVILTLTTDDPAGLCPVGVDQMLHQIDSAALVDAGPDQFICVGDTIYLNATLSGVATALVWEKNVAFGDFIDPDTWPSTRYVLNATGQALSSISFGVMTNDPGSNVCQGGVDTVIIFINQNNTSVSIQASDFNGYSISCNGADDGSATAIPSGGSEPYTYLWSNGEQTATISNLSPGTYTVTVTGACGDDASSTVTITEPPQLTVAANPITNFNGFNVSCFKASDGEALATASGGTGAISYLWSNGIANDTVTGLSAGTHTVTVTDANGCTEQATVDLTEPSMLLVDAGPNKTLYRGYPDSSCTVIQATGTGGVPPYTYLWSNGNTSASFTSCALTSRTLYVTITDANNCTHVDSVRICVIDVRCGTGRTKVRMCHATNNPNNPFRTICVDVAAARAHLQNHSGDQLGRCGTNHSCDWPATVRYEDLLAEYPESDDEIVFGALPNPFSGQTTIRFSLPDDDVVSVYVTDVTGRKVATLYEGETESGIVYEAIFDGSEKGDGIYFITLLTQSGELVVKKIIQTR